MADVFISHSHEDAGPAALICRRLEAAGIRCWIAPRDVPPAGDYADAIVQGLSGARVLLLLLSESANGSAHVRMEVEHAARKQILPARLENVVPTPALNFFISNRQWIDLHPDLNGRLPALVEAVRNVLADDLPPPPPPSVPWRDAVRTTVSWTAIAAIGVLWILAVRQWIAPLVPVTAVHRLLAAAPLATLLPVAALAAAALALNYQAQRRQKGVWKLRALFTTSSNGGRLRIAGAVVLAFAVAIAWMLAPAAIAVDLKPVELPPPAADYDVVYVNPSSTVTNQSASHYEFALTRGTALLEGRYTLTLRLREYASENGLEFGKVYFDRRISQPDQREPDPDYQNRWATFRIPLRAGDLEGTRRILATFAYDPRSGAAGNDITVSLGYEDYPPVEKTYEIDVRRWAAR